jgi:hypothetical protein
MAEGGYLRPRRHTGRTHELTIVAQDPLIRDREHGGEVLTAKVRVPFDRLEVGPRSHRFHVVDYDAGAATLHPPTRLTADSPSGAQTLVDQFRGGDPDLVQSQEAFGFHAQNVYAIAARTLARFERSLGRRLPWAFGGHQLFLVPHAFAEANAYYAGDDRAIYFGYLPGEGGRTVYTCLSHDIVAHETTHAVLDGLRPRFDEPGLPDQAAFHEAFADIVALLSVLSIREVVERLLGPADPVTGRIPAERVSGRNLMESALFGVAEQLGEATLGERGSALRRSVTLVASPTSWRTDPAYDEPHRRGEVLVAAIMQALLAMWLRRLQPLVHGGGLDRARAAEEGAKSADHLLGMAIRAIDYCPPLEFEFADFLDAALVADAELAPDDEHEYRASLRRVFRRFGIGPPAEPMVDLSTVRRLPRYESLNFTALRSDRDEVFRFIWANADRLGIDRRWYLYVQDVRPSTRVGPDGLVVNETVAEYVQFLSGSGKELSNLGVTVPAAGNQVEIRLLGGGVIVFDQFGRAKYHRLKRIDDWDRQSRRLAYLYRNGLRDTRDRLGFSLGTRHGQRFVEFHAPNSRAGESW